MRNLSASFLLFFITSSSFAQKQSSVDDWKAVSFEKIQLVKTVPESVIFTKNSHKGDVAYTMSYVVDKTVLRTITIPSELYQNMKKKLQSEVVLKGKKANKVTCRDEIAIIRGIASELGTPSVVCLSLTGEATPVQESFSKWYKEARSYVGL